MKSKSNGEKIVFCITIIIIIIVICYVIYTVFSSNKSFYENTSGNISTTRNDNITDKTTDESILSNEIDSMNIKEETIDEITNSTNNALKETEIATFTSTLYDKDENRVHNIGLAISAINGKIVKNNEEFSFNNTVGPMDESHGYKEAVRI